jgi:thioredoxin
MSNNMSQTRHDGAAVTVTEENFEQLASGDKPLFIDFWAVWCGPCKIMEPVVDRLAAKYSGKVLFGKVNVDEEMNLSSQYQVLSIPTFMIFKNGQPMDAVIGAVGEAALDQFLSRALNGHSHSE